MARDTWRIALEAYLDGELPAAEAEAFAAQTAIDPQLQAELETRLALRDQWRRTLGEASDPEQGLDATKPRYSRLQAGRTWKPWIPVALAACLAVAIGIPRLLRNDNGAEGPRSTITLSGQVAALRFGEIPDETAILETGFIELSAGLSR